RPVPVAADAPGLRARRRETVQNRGGHGALVAGAGVKARKDEELHRRPPPLSLDERCFECRPCVATHRDPVRRGGIRPLPGPRIGMIERATTGSQYMATSRTPASLLVRIDSRLRAGLQQQIYGSIRRAILDGIVAPGARLPSSRALAADLGVSRTTTLLAVHQLQTEGYLTTRRGSGTSVAAELPHDLLQRRTGASPSRSRHPALPRRGMTVVASPHGAERLSGPPRAFRLGTPALDLFPLSIWSRLVNRRLRSVTGAQLDYGDPAGVG